MSVEATLQELQQQLSTARGSLRDVDDDIYKLPNIGRGLNANRRGRGGPGRIFRAAMGFQSRGGMRGGMVGQRIGPRRMDEFDRPRDEQLYRNPMTANDFDDDAQDQSLLKSEVIAKDASQTREEALKERSKELKKFSGSRRLFQVGLLGTLSKFREENKTNEKQVQKEKEVEQKLAAAAQKEVDEVDNARRQLLFKRKAKWMEVVKIERKMGMIRMQNEYEKHTKQYMSFIQTNSKPPIFWIPKIPTEKSFEMHKKSNARLEKMMLRHKETLEKQLKKMDGIIDDKNKQAGQCNVSEHDADMEVGEGDEPVTKRLKSSVVTESGTGNENTEGVAIDIDAEIGKDVSLSFGIGLDCETEGVDVNSAEPMETDHSEGTVQPEGGEEAGSETKLDKPQQSDLDQAEGKVEMDAGQMQPVLTDLSDIPLPGQETDK